MESSRDARRRKILERGNDRLAFITGQTRTIPPTTAITTSSNAPAPSPTPQSPPRSNYLASVGKNQQTSLDLPKDDPGAHDIKDSLEASSTCEITPELTKTEVASGLDIDKKTTTVGESDKKPNLVEEPFANISTEDPAMFVLRKSPHNDKTMFTPSKISNSISATEDTRLLCSIIIAMLVVLSYHVSLLGRSILGSILIFRPLFLVLLTDISVVIGNLMAAKAMRKMKQRSSREMLGQMTLLRHWRKLWFSKGL